MCECPCGEVRGDMVYQDGDRFLVIDRYRGCEGCGTVPSVVLYRFTPEEAADYDIRTTGALPVPEILHAVLFEPADIAEAAKDYLKDNPDYTPDDYDLPELVAEVLPDLMHRACLLYEARQRAEAKRLRRKVSRDDLQP